MAILKREDNNAQTTLDAHDVHTILGHETSFEGKLSFEGTVRIDGHFKGEIQTNGSVIIGQSARVEAQITVNTIVIHGEVVGDITAKQLIEINTPGKVRGKIRTPQLLIAKGVIFEGTSEMEESLRTIHNNPTGKVTLLTSKDNAKERTKEHPKS